MDPALERHVDDFFGRPRTSVIEWCVHLVAVERSLFPVPHPPHSARERAGKGMGYPIGTADVELDFLVDLARQAPTLIRGPHQVRRDMDAWRLSPRVESSRVVYDPVIVTVSLLT